MEGNNGRIKQRLAGSAEKGLRPEYKKMLNNLLGISGQDGAILANRFTRNLGQDATLAHASFKKTNFSIEMTGISELSEQILESENREEISDIVAGADITLTKYEKVLLKTDFESAKKLIAFKLEEDDYKKVARWKIYQNRYVSYQIQKNS